MGAKVGEDSSRGRKVFVWGGAKVDWVRLGGVGSVQVQGARCKVHGREGYGCRAVWTGAAAHGIKPNPANNFPTSTTLHPLNPTVQPYNLTTLQPYSSYSTSHFLRHSNVNPWVRLQPSGILLLRHRLGICQTMCDLLERG